MLRTDAYEPAYRSTKSGGEGSKEEEGEKDTNDWINREREWIRREKEKVDHNLNYRNTKKKSSIINIRN